MRPPARCSFRQFFYALEPLFASELVAIRPRVTERENRSHHQAFSRDKLSHAPSPRTEWLTTTNPDGNNLQ
jgi:hypothetical protein